MFKLEHLPTRRRLLLVLGRIDKRCNSQSINSGTEKIAAEEIVMVTTNPAAAALVYALTAQFFCGPFALMDGDDVGCVAFREVVTTLRFV
jgi:hypothetical protein